MSNHELLFVGLFYAGLPIGAEPAGGKLGIPKTLSSEEPVHLLLVQVFDKFAIVNLGRLDKLEGDTFNVDSLLAAGVINKVRDGLKVLGTGQLTRSITVEAHQFSKSAVEKIQKAGGTAQVIGAAAQ